MSKEQNIVMEIKMMNQNEEEGPEFNMHPYLSINDKSGIQKLDYSMDIPFPQQIKEISKPTILNNQKTIQQSSKCKSNQKVLLQLMLIKLKCMNLTKSNKGQTKFVNKPISMEIKLSDDFLKSQQSNQTISSDIARTILEIDKQNYQKRNQEVRNLSIRLQNLKFIIEDNSCNNIIKILTITINDPSKQVIKDLLYLTGQVICAISQNKLNQNALKAIYQLIERFNNQRQYEILELYTPFFIQIAEDIGRQFFLSNFAPFFKIEEDAYRKHQFLKLIDSLSEGLTKANIKYYEDILNDCSKDKDKNLSNLAKSILKSLNQKQGFQVCLIDDNIPDKQIIYDKQGLHKIYANINKLDDQMQRRKKKISSKDKFNPNQTINQLDQIAMQVNKIFDAELAAQMLSLNYIRVYFATYKISKYINENKKKSNLDKVYDVLLKWAFVRIFGGQNGHFMIHLVDQMLSVLTQISNFEVELAVAIIRQYLLSSKFEIIYSSKVFKKLVILKKDIALKSLLRQLGLDVRLMHQKLQKDEEINAKMKQSWIELIKKNMDLLLQNNKQFLSQISAIKELRQNSQLLQILKGKFQENLLLKYGFKDIQPNSNQQIKKLSHQATRKINIFDQIERINIKKYLTPHPSNQIAKKLKESLIQKDTAIVKLLQEKKQKNIIANLKQHAKFIFGSILKNVYQVIKQRRNVSGTIVFQLNLLQNCIKCPHIIQNIGQLLEYGVNFILTQQVYEDQHKKQIEQKHSQEIGYKNEVIINAIKGVRLCFLEKANPWQIVNILIEFLTKISSKNLSPKLINLIIESLSLVSNDFCENVQPEEVKIFLINSYQYLASIRYDKPLQSIKVRQKQKSRPEDAAANLIKTIIDGTYNSINSQIWKIYQKAQTLFESSDKYIARYIKSLEVQNNFYKQLNEKISFFYKNRDVGGRQLRKFLQKKPNFQLIPYLKSQNFDQKTSSKILDALEEIEKKDERQNSLGSSNKLIKRTSSLQIIFLPNNKNTEEIKDIQNDNENPEKKMKKRLYSQDKIQIDDDIQRQISDLIKNNDAFIKEKRKVAQKILIYLKKKQKIDLGNINKIPNLLQILQKKVKYPNKQISQMFAYLSAQILCENPLKPLGADAKNLVSSLINELHSSDQNHRKQIHTVLKDIAKRKGQKVVISSIGDSLEGNKLGRPEILKLIKLSKEGITKADFIKIRKGLATCLRNSIKIIRDDAGEIIDKFIEKIGLEAFQQIDNNKQLIDQFNKFNDRRQKFLNTKPVIVNQKQNQKIEKFNCKFKEEGQNRQKQYKILQIILQKYQINEFDPKLGKLINEILTPNHDKTHNAINALFNQTQQIIVNKLAANAKFIFSSILKSVCQIINGRRKNTPNRIVAQLILLVNCIQCPQIIQNIGQLLEHGANFAITQLVYQDQHSNQIQHELHSRKIKQQAVIILKAVNRVMLRFLEKANPQQIVNILIKLLAKYSTENFSSKIIKLTIKCLGHASRRLCGDIQNIQQEGVKAFLLNSHQYLTSINYDTQLYDLNLAQKQKQEIVRFEDTAASLIKTIISGTCKSIDSKIWKIYQQAQNLFKYPDRYIAPFIKTLNPKMEKKKESQRQQNILEKINKIKQRLMQSQPKDKQNQNIFSKISKKTDQQREQREAHIKQRIQEMKNRMVQNIKKPGSK